jgi:hypothetical protein
VNLAWSLFHRRIRGTIYTHFPCFDGTISAVLAALFLQQSRGWRIASLYPLNYAQQNQWLQLRLPPHSAVVDFLYHPQAEFWADHHSTSFLTPQCRADFESRRSDSLFYDDRSGSCASLLWRNLGPFFRGDDRLEEMVCWAEKIDSAAYESVQEALSGSEPALVLSRSLAIDADARYLSFLVKRLQRRSLAEVAAQPEVRRRMSRFEALSKDGLKRMQESIRVQDYTAIFEADTDGVLISRYAPYYFYPDALYSIGVTYSQNGIKITAMRNPWLHFESVNLGRFMRQFGGGGHQRVGSLILPKSRRAEVGAVISDLLRYIAAGDCTRVNV